MEFDKEALKGYIDPILLSLLVENPMYGYSLSQKIYNVTDGLFEIKEATLYLSLKRLEKNGLVLSYWDENSGQGGRRKYYSITPDGINRLNNKKLEWVKIQRMINYFLGGYINET